MTADAHPTPKQPAAPPVGPTSRAHITALVHAFYRDVVADDQLGPVFAPHVGADWAHHLDRMVEFWCTVLLRTRSFRGDVLRKHVALLPALQPEHFARWLGLWCRHTAQHLNAADAAELQATAAGIARNLHLGCFGSVPRFERDGDAVRLAGQTPWPH
jgi:hemoglobin